jgi:hypothetical protein
LKSRQGDSDFARRPVLAAARWEPAGFCAMLSGDPAPASRRRPHDG